VVHPRRDLYNGFDALGPLKHPFLSSTLGPRLCKKRMDMRMMQGRLGETIGLTESAFSIFAKNVAKNIGDNGIT
jgi:hypothetical protein